MLEFLKRLHREEEGQDVIEYALLGAFISIIAIIAIQAVGGLVNDIFTNIQTELTP
ncbi:MAG: Flp family type IVb pilin [Candidatus Eisenbacteria bacterium]